MLKNSFVLFLSILCSLVLAEITVKQFFSIPSFSELELRYLLNGVRSFTPGFYLKSNEFPIESKRNIDIVYEDMYSTPFSSRVSTDSLGFRNKQGAAGKAKTVVVGDSLTFGYGLSDDETITSRLETEVGGGFYNLSVSGWGPASYMKAVQDFSRENQFSNLFILYFTGNDDYNLKSACWPELQMCQSPDSGSITRKDMKDYRVYAPPNYLVLTPLKYSSLVYLIFSYFNESPVELFNKDLNSTFEQPSVKDITKTLGSLDSLSKGYCISKNDKEKIFEIKSLIRAGRFSEADRVSYIFSKGLISRDCAPLVLGTGFTDGLEKKMNYAFLARWNVSSLNVKRRKRKEFLFNDRNECDFQCKDYTKEQIFVKWMNDMAKKHNVYVFVLPAEYLLDLRNSPNSLHWTCKASGRKYNCVDLRGDIFYYYNNNDRALYHDGSHLNKLGVDFVVEKIKSNID